MLKAIGVRGSANWHQVALQNWARLSDVKIGVQGSAGWSLFVEPGIVYVIEHRGPGFPPFRHEFPARFDEQKFCGGPIDRWLWSAKRAQAFRSAVAVLERLRDGK